MKRIASIAFSLLIITSIVFNNSALCTADSFQTPLETDNILISETVEYFPDGSSITITITESSAITYATKYTKTGTKTYSARNSSGEIQWQFMINGTFTVTEGISSVCTSASYSYNILNSNWSFNGGSAHTADNAAVGSGEFTRTLFFIPVETRECNVTLTCDNNGSLS